MPTAVAKDLLSSKQEKIKQVLYNEVYGVMPDCPVHLGAETVCEDIGFAAGKAVLRHKNLIIDIGDKELRIPFSEVIPNGKSNCPAIIYLCFEDEVPNKYLPAEEISDRGYAIFSLNLKRVSENDGNFKSGVCADIARSRRKKNAPGKLMLWAWAAIRLMEYVASVESIDGKSIAVAGHGLPGKAALIAGALDGRFSFTIANDAAAFGVGANSDYGKLSLIMPHLFCPAFTEGNFEGCEQAMLLSLCAPRSVLVGCAADDPRSAPELEYEAIKEASLFYPNTVLQKEIPTANTLVQTGSISYHLRGGMHYFSREDWKIYLDFIDKNR